MYVDGTSVLKARTGDDVVDRARPHALHAESGGQVGDSGELATTARACWSRTRWKIQATVHRPPRHAGARRRLTWGEP